jgi:hypothetical protein
MKVWGKMYWDDLKNKHKATKEAKERAERERLQSVGLPLINATVESIIGQSPDRARVNSGGNIDSPEWYVMGDATIDEVTFYVDVCADDATVGIGNSIDGVFTCRNKKEIGEALVELDKRKKSRCW